MRISELVGLLEKVKEEHGDVAVWGWPYDGQVPREDGIVAWIRSKEETTDPTFEFVEPKDPGCLTKIVFIDFG